jgi:RNA polymerase-binding transcription factor DksA
VTARFGIGFAPRRGAGLFFVGAWCQYLFYEVSEIMDGILLQTVEGLGDAPLVPTGGEIWEWLQGEKEEVAQGLLSDGPLCQPAVSGVQEVEASEENWREIEWRHRAQMEARLREINDAQDRLMGGDYGRCIDCGAEIGTQRLAADFATSLCINCQRSTECEAEFALTL